MSDPLAALRLDRLRRLRDLQREAEQIKHGVARYYDDPVGFARDCIDWRDDPGLTVYQQDIIGSLPERKREAVRGPHGLGKSTISAVTLLWFALTRDAAGVDWKAVTTAGAWRQLINYLWPEVHKWAARLRWEKIRDQPFNKAELLNLNLRLSHGAAFAAACTNPALIEGCHADSLLFIYDESKAIPAGTFDACEGAFSGTGEALALALSTPGSPQGRFYDIHSRRPGYEDWTPRHVTLSEAIEAGRISPEWAGQRARQWGTASAIYINRVLGDFHAGDEDSVIPLSWAEQAVERWHEWAAAGKPDTGFPRTVGVDVARTGQDRTVLAIRNGPVLTELRRYVKEDTMQTTGHVMGVLEAGRDRTAIVDVIGIGAGVVDRLHELGALVTPFNASGASRQLDVSGELGFTNLRSEAWWSMRERLDPSANPDLCLPDDEMLLSDLSAPQWRVQSGGKIQVESKDTISARLGRSTDDGDAAVQAFHPQSLPHTASVRQWSGTADLERVAAATRPPWRRPEDRPRQADPLAPARRADLWDEESFAPQPDDGTAGRRGRPNVRSWR